MSDRYAVAFTLNGYDATLNTTFDSRREARGVAASLEEDGATGARVVPAGPYTD